MTIRSAIVKIVQQEHLNFLLTNRIPRRLTTRFMGWFSRIEQPLIRDISIAVWRFFSDLDVTDAKERHFRSMHDCFTRRLKDGARLIDPDPGVIVSPCDGIVGASGTVQEGQILQVKDSPYALSDLLGDVSHAKSFCNGSHITLRLTSSMYHRFHAPYDCLVEAVTHIAGDTWNVNPPSLRRIERLFCKNERAVITMRLSATGYRLTLVAVAAILVAGIRLRFLELKASRDGWNILGCNTPLSKGEEMGWFEHGSTIVVFAPEGFRLCGGVEQGMTIRVGQRLMQIPM